MTMKITGPEIRPATGVTSIAAPKSRAVDSDNAGQAAGAQRDVKVSDAARNMADVEALALKSSGIDAAKVEALRLAIERGEYQIDPKTIADQLLRLDWEIGKASGRVD